MGLEAETIRDAAHGDKKKYGRFGYLVSAVRAWRRRRLTRYAIAYDDQIISRRAHTVFVTNVGTVGIPGLNLTWQITKIEVSQSGDLAYVQSTYEASFEDPQGGKPAIEKGKAVTVWNKQGDTWKAVADISNTDAPPPEHKESRNPYQTPH